MQRYVSTKIFYSTIIYFVFFNLVSAQRREPSEFEIQKSKILLEKNYSPILKIATPITLPYFYDVEMDDASWTKTGFWNRVENPEKYYVDSIITGWLVKFPDGGQLPSAHSASHAFWYGEKTTGTFIGSDFNRNQAENSGGTSIAANSGDLISPIFDLSNHQNAYLEFWTWWEIEGVDADRYDMMHILISTNLGETWTNVANLNPVNDLDGASFVPHTSQGLGVPAKWQKHILDLSNYCGSHINIRFFFETRDKLYNGFRGWFIDDISVKGEKFPSPDISYVDPKFAHPGIVVDIFGTNFSVFPLGSTVSLINQGGNAFNISGSSVVSSSQIRFITPTISDGIYSVVVTNSFGLKDTLNNSLTITTTDIPPSIISVEANNVNFGDNVNINIFGNNFQNNSSVFLGIQQLNVIEIQPTYIKALGLPLPVGTYTCKVVNPSGIFEVLVNAYTVNPIKEIFVKIDTNFAINKNLVLIPVFVSIPSGKSFGSIEFTLSGYSGKLEFVGTDTVETLLGGAKWMHITNSANEKLIFAGAGSENIAGAGCLIYLKFKVLNNECSFIPINFNKVLFGTGTDSIKSYNGGVWTKPMPSIYGDVDLNGLVQSEDASKILKFIVGKDTISCQGQQNADVTANGYISALDAAGILMYRAELINSFPVDSLLIFPNSASATIQVFAITSPVSKEIEIPIQYQNGKNIFSFEGRLTYDTSALEFIQYLPSTETFAINNNRSLSEIRFAGAGTKTANPSGNFGRVKFRTLKNGNYKIKLSNIRLNEGISLNNILVANIVTSIRQTQSITPKAYMLMQNHPNPFNPTTNISFDIPKASFVSLRIYNSIGKEAAVIVNEHLNTGSFVFQWDATNMPSGVYFYRLQANEFVSTKRMLLLK